MRARKSSLYRVFSSACVCVNVCVFCSTAASAALASVPSMAVPSLWPPWPSIQSSLLATRFHPLCIRLVLSAPAAHLQQALLASEMLGPTRKAVQGNRSTQKVCSLCSPEAITQSQSLVQRNVFKKTVILWHFTLRSVIMLNNSDTAVPGTVWWSRCMEQPHLQIAV